MKDVILSRLKKVSGNGIKYKACCPAHDDKSPSLSILFNPDGRILIHCHAGCDANDVLAELGLSLTDLYPDGAIRDFMASATVNKPNGGKYDSWLELLDRKLKNLKHGERLTEETLKLAREMYKRSKQIVR